MYEFISKKEDFDFLFHHPRVKPRAPVLGALAGIDNWWHGGIDEILPTAFFSNYRGDDLPIIGELWAQNYECKILTQKPDELEAYLQTSTVISPFRIEKWVSLREGEPSLNVRTRITNTGYSDYHFLWGYHCTLAVNPDCRIDIPAGKVIVEDFSASGSRFKPGLEYQWPHPTDNSGKPHDLSKVLDSSSKMHEFHYATNLKSGWLAVTNSKRKIGFGISFPKEVLTTIFVWINYGVWRNCYNLGLYPMSGYPGPLHKAIEQGTCSHLDAGKSLECQVKFLTYSGTSMVSGIGIDGKVT